MKGIKRILLDFLIFLAVGALFVGGYYVVLRIEINRTNRSNARYDYPKEEYLEANNAYSYSVDEKDEKSSLKRLGTRPAPDGYALSVVFGLKGMETDEYLYYKDVWWTSATGYLAVRKGVDEPILRFPVKTMQVLFESDKKDAVYSLKKADLTPALRSGVLYDMHGEGKRQFSDQKIIQLLFDLPCKLYYQCVLAKEAETNSLYFLYKLVDESTGEEDWTTKWYICEVTDLLADRLPKDFWE